MSSALDRINEYNKKKKEQYTTAVNKTNEVYGGVSALDRIDNYSKTHNLTLNDNNKATPNAVASVSEYSNLSKEQLLTKRKDLLNQLNNYEREEKVKWWDEDNNIFENVGNVLYKTFVEDQKTKYKDDTELEKLKKQYEDISKEIENRTIQEESQNLSTLDKIGYTITGNLSTSLKGIESTAQKILGQTPENADLTYEERMAQVSREQTSGLGGVALDVLGSASRMLPQMAIGNPIGATTMGFANYGGSAYNEAKRSGADETRATLYGIAVGGLETALNKILPSFNYGGENIFGKTLSDKLTSKIMNKVLGNGVLKRVIADGAGEFTEEYLQQFLEPIIKESILEENHGVGIIDAKTIGEIAKNLAIYTKDNFFSSENAYAGMLGFISSASLGLPSNIMQNQINQNISNNTAISNKNVQNGINRLTNETNVETGTKYSYLPTNNEKSNNLRQSASNYFSDSQETINMIDAMDKVIQDKGYNILFDNTITNTNGQSVNAQIKTLDNGEVEIRINPNSPRAGEFLLCHEITHAIETDSMKQLVMDYASKNVEFNQALESLKQTYGTNEITSEVLADISGQLFGNQEFINNLSMQQPNVFKRIYNKIVELANKITGNSKESLFIKDLKNKWETAYRTQNNNLNNGIKFSTIGLKGANNLSKNSDSRYYKNLLNNQEIASEIFNNSNETLENTNIKSKRETGWFQTKYGDWGTLISDKNSRLMQKLEPNRTYRLGDILEHELLYQAYPELKKLKVKTSDIDSTGGYASLPLLPANTITNEIYIRNSDLNKKDFRKTLLHEINHYIGHKENYDKRSIGTSSKIDGKEGYRNNLGELISNETKINADLTQEELDAIILPEQAKKNPQYKNIREKLLESNKNDLLKNGDDNNALQNLELPIQNKIKNNKVANKKDSKSRRIVNDAEELDNSSFSYDNQGRTLTKEQQEYFKDSKVRDENGNLLTVYHGTRNNFTVFDIEKTGQSNGLESKAGFWFTESENGAKQFSNEVWYGENENAKAIETYLNLKNPKIYEKVDNSQKISDIKFQKKEISSQLGKYYDKYNVIFDIITNQPEQNTFNDISRYTNLSENELKRTIKEWAKADNVNEYYNDVIKYRNLIEQQRMLEKQLSDLRYTDSYEQFRSDIYKTAGKSPTDANFGGTGMALDNNEEVMRQYIANLKKQGYDGIIIKETNYDNNRFGENNNQYVAFYSNQIKNVDNVNPTSNEDIRYSQQDNTWQEHLEKNYKATGTRTDMRKNLYPLETTQIENKTVEKLPTAKRNIPQDPTKESTYDDVKKTRKDVQQELQSEMGITIDDISKGNDISSIDLSRTDPIRVNEKVFGAELGQRINDVTINKTKHNEAERTRWLNNERSEIKSLGIKAGSKESEAVQKYGEKQYITRDNEVILYGDEQLAKDFPNVEIQNKIKKAAQIIRNKYDKYIEQINEVLVDMGYSPIKKRNDYMRHFQALNDVFSRFGIPLNKESMQNDSLPTDINGLTDQFKPGKQYFANAMQRLGMRTEYDAITGIDGYLEGASNLIYHTEDIQRYRALSKMVRDSFGAKHGFDDFESMSVQQQEQRIADIQSNKLAKYAAWLDEQANALAGKKGKIDRGAEELFGRKVYTVLQTAKKQVGSNMTGYNVRSALTNFASAIQGASKTNKIAFLKGTMSTINNIVHNDDLINKSDFLTNRFGSDSLSPKLWQKMSNAGQIFMKGSDYFTANQVWRSKYYENLSNGMSESEAIRRADDFASRVMGDRSKGSTATIFNSNTLGFLTQFQLEVNNQWSSLIHDNKMDVQRGNKTGASVVFQLGQLFAMSYLFNNMMKSLTGSGVMIDPIELLKKMFNPDDDEKTLEERTTEVLGEVVNNIPFASIFTGGRIPISEAFEGISTGFKYATGQTDEYGNKYTLSDVKDDMIESAFYWLLPTGYGQAKKTIKGASMYSGKLPTAGSYTASGNLRFTADESAGGKAKALLFGQYSSKEAQNYIDSGFKTISKNHIQEMKDLGMTSTEYRKYRTGLSKAGTTNSEKLDYINNLNVSIEQKNIMANNVVDSEKYTVDMSNYNDYGSYDATKYAMGNPTNYSIITSITKYDNYLSHKDEVNNIKEKYGGTEKSTVRKQKVFEYINSLPYNKAQKIILFKMLGNYSISDYQNDVFNYVNGLKISKSEKEQMWKQIYGK